MSPWISDVNMRFQNGIYFDVVFGIGLVLNVLFVIAKSTNLIKFKAMEFINKRKVKQAQKEKITQTLNE